MRSRCRGRGFTLVETLVVVSLMALVGGAMVSALTAGLHVWQRAAEFSQAGQSALIALSQMRQDLHNIRRFARLPFEGAYDRYAAAAVDRGGLGPDEPAALGRVGYFVRERDHALCRSFVPYPDVRTQDVTDRCQPMLEGVARVRFSYFGQHPEGGGEGWSEHWDGNPPPLAVKIEVVTQAGRQPPATHALLVALPIQPSDEQPKK